MPPEQSVQGEQLLHPKHPIILKHIDPYLAHGLIFNASPRLMQKPAPPVANQKFTGR